MNKTVPLLLIMLFCGFSLTGCSQTETTVCKVNPEKSNVNTNLTISLTSQDGVVQKVTQEEKIELKDYNMTKKQFNEVVKELKETYKNYKGLTYKSEVTDKEAVQTIEIDCNEADEETMILVGISVDTSKVKEGEKVSISLSESVQNLEDYGLECK